MDRSRQLTPWRGLSYAARCRSDSKFFRQLWMALANLRMAAKRSPWRTFSRLMRRDVEQRRAGGHSVSVLCYVDIIILYYIILYYIILYYIILYNTPPRCMSCVSCSPAYRSVLSNGTAAQHGPTASHYRIHHYYTILLLYYLLY